MGEYWDVHDDWKRLLPDDLLLVLETALENDNIAQVDRLVAAFTRNVVHGIDLMTFRQWRGIVRGDFIGDLKGSVLSTLAHRGWQPH